MSEVRVSMPTTGVHRPRSAFDLVSTGLAIVLVAVILGVTVSVIAALAGAPAGLVGMAFVVALPLAYLLCRDRQPR